MTRNQQLMVLGGVLLLAGCCLVTMLGSAGGIVIFPKVLPQIFVVRPTPTPVVIVVTPLYVPPPTEIPPAPLPTTIYAPPTVPAPVPTTPPIGGGGSSSWTPEQKCAYLVANFPQTDIGVQSLLASLANVPVDRIAPHEYPCNATTTVYDGGIVLGPIEGWNNPFTMAVPVGGAIDVYPGATCTGTSRVIDTEKTIRCMSGEVVNVARATFWAWDDEFPPNSGITPATSSASCVDPTVLATQMGWKDSGWADPTYGGLRVELTSVGQLPPKWEAVASGRKITESDSTREMVPDFWTIYPPYSCREELGYK